MGDQNSDLEREKIDEKIEGNFQNAARNLMENDDEEITDSWKLEDIELVQTELLKMNDAKQKSHKQILDLQEKLKEEQKAIADRQTAKLKLQKEIVELEGQLNDDKYQHDVIKKDLNNMREMSKSIGKYSVRSETMLEQCSKDRSAFLEKTEKLKIKLFENIAKLEEACYKRRHDITSMKETVETQQNIYHDHLQSCDEADALLQAHTSSLSSIAVTEADDITLEEVWSRKQQHSGNLLQHMEEELQAFEQRKEEISNLLNEARFTLQKKETEIEGVQSGIINQTEYNNNFREKLAAKVKEIGALRLQTEQLEAAQSEKLLQVFNKEESLTVIYNSKLEEEKNAENLLSAEREILNKTEEQIKEAKKINQELVCHIGKQETIVAELKKKQICQLDAISSFEQEIATVQLKLTNLKEELHKWQQKFVQYECKMLEAIASKSASKNSAVAESVKIENEKQETAHAVVLQIESIKLNFDIETAQETSEFEKKKNELKHQIEIIEKDLSSTRTIQMQLNDELEQLNKNCDNIFHKINQHEALKQTLTIIPEPPILTLLPADDYNFRDASCSTIAASSSRMDGTAGSSSTTIFFLPSSGLFKPRAFDELSDSSVEGNTVTYQQIRDLRQEITKETTGKGTEENASSSK